MPEPIEIPELIMNKKALRDEQRRLAKVVKKEILNWRLYGKRRR